MNAFIGKIPWSCWGLRGLLLIIIGCAIIGPATPKAFADLTIDLRASAFVQYSYDPDTKTAYTGTNSTGIGGGTISADRKTISGVVSGDIIAFDLWAQVTNTSGGIGYFGLRNVMGSVVSSNASGLSGSTGWMSTDVANNVTIFNAQTGKGISDIVQAWKSGSTTYGNSVDLNNDNSQDLGSVGTDVNTNYIHYACDLTAGDSAYSHFQMVQVKSNGTLGSGSAGTVHDASLINNNTLKRVTNDNGFGKGVEFKLGQVAFTVVNNNGGSLRLNWTYPTSLSSGQSSALGFYDGMGTQSGYSAGFHVGVGTGFAVGTYHSGPDVLIQGLAVPEPGTWAMLVGGVGLLALLGRRRRRL